MAGLLKKMEDTSQICFREVDGTIVFFNEAEAVCDLNAAELEDLELKSPKQPKRKGKKEADLSESSILALVTRMTCTMFTSEKTLIQISE